MSPRLCPTLATLTMRSSKSQRRPLTSSLLPRSFTCAIAASSRDWLRPTSTISAPIAASFTEASRPIPDVAPVTSMVCQRAFPWAEHTQKV